MSGKRGGEHEYLRQDTIDTNTYCANGGVKSLLSNQTQL